MAEAPLALLLEYLDANLQPTFIIQLAHPDRKARKSEQELIFTHANSALLGLEPLHIEIVKQLQRSPDASRFVSLDSPSRTNPTNQTVSFCGIDWAVTIVGHKWLIAVSTALHDGQNDSRHAKSSRALPSTSTPAKATIHTPNNVNASAPSAHESGQRRLLGAVKPNGQLGDAEYLEWIRQYDWASSPVGPVDEWPKELRSMYEFALASSDPINILWGDECTLLYNYPYSIIIGDKHPQAMGRPFKENFAQWPEYYELFARMKETGQSAQQEKMRRMLVRDGFLEEDFFDFLMVPVLASNGAVVGFTTRIHEATQRIVFERRIRILTDTNKAISTTRTVQDLCVAAADALNKHTSDIHFAAFYSTSFQEHTLDLTLEATAGMVNDVTAPSRTDNLRVSQFGLHHALREVCRDHEPKILSTSDGSLTQSTLSELRGQGVGPCREVVIHPLKCFVEDNIAAVMIVGTSPLRKFDEDYRSFLKLLTRQIESGITVVRGILREREMHKKQLNSELEKRLLSEAIEQKRQQENFLDVISHEMRNPLNAIFQCAYELAENIKSKLKRSNPSHKEVDALNESLDLATTITYCANHQKRIVDDVLTLSKLDARLLQIYPESTNPIKLYKEILGLFAPEIKASGMNTSFVIGESYNRLDVKHVMVDPNRVTQIVINLLSNAIKFTKKGKKRDLEMTLDAHLVEPSNRPMGTRYVPSGVQHQDPTGLSEWGHEEVLYLSFSVKDSGLGMTPEEASNLFQKFSQASPRTHIQFGGSGLGLYISRNLAELHGGRIGLSSQAGYGSTFEFYVKVRRSPVLEVPTMPVDDPTSGDESRHMIITSPIMQQNQPVQRSVSPSSEIQTTPRSSQQNVLVVEDNLINQRLLCRLISKQGYDTTSANNGEEALALIASSTWNPIHTKKDSDIVPTIDIVLCDIEMPIMDGKTCVRRVRQLQQEGLLTRDIPMIAITGNVRLEQVEEMRQCGFDDVVTKPYKIGELLRVIERYVGKRDDPSPALVI